MVAFEVGRVNGFSGVFSTLLLIPKQRKKPIEFFRPLRLLGDRWQIGRLEYRETMDHGVISDLLGLRVAL